MAHNKLRQPKMRQIKIVFAIFAGLTPLACGLDVPDSDRYLHERLKSHVEVRAIRNLLKGFNQDKAKDENIGIIIGYEDVGYLLTLDHRPARYIAYFKYRHGDESIVVHYHLFPVREKYSDTNRIKDNDIKFDSLLEKFAAGPSDAFFYGAKQLEMPLPKGLKNDSLLSKPYKKREYHVIVDGLYIYYWGFSLKNCELIQKLDMYPEYLFETMYSDILTPIELRLVHHETPAEWFAEYREKYCEGIPASCDQWLELFGIKK